ncbi:hypothetical protein [Sulfurimonas sp.]|uniref:hypothetical protein n=1 Tax=Sulfurimonas sp. TaxID=2022749 RepID=UPI002B495090|nr:hypothetical protein [Sulfurimonas sp.]
MDGLIAVPHEEGLSILKNELFERIQKFELIDSNNNVYYSHSIHSSYFDNDGVLTITLIIPKENHFTVWNKAVRIKSDNNLIIADIQTPAIQFVRGVGGTQEIKLAVSGEAGVINFKADEYITDSELNDLYISPINEKLSQKALLGGSASQLFKVKDAVDTNEAVNKGQMENAIEAKRSFPIGFQYTQIKSAPAENELLQIGGVFLRADYPLLWTYIETQTSLLKTEVDWQTENLANQMCGYFSKGDGSTTFRLMNLKDAFFRAVDGVNRKAGSFQTDEIISHKHSHTTGHGGGNWGTAYYGAPTAIADDAQNTGLTGGAETRPKNIATLPLIIAK